VIMRKLLHGGARSIEVAGEQLLQGGTRVELGDPTRSIQRMANILEPDDLAVGRVEERAPEPVEAVGAASQTGCVPLRLCQDVLRAEG
jgi:hypothetical protein